MAKFIPRNIPDLKYPISRFRGLNVSVDRTQLQPNESPNMRNMLVDIEGALVERSGYVRIFADSLGAGKTNGLYDYRKADGTLTRLLHHGTKLYTWDDSGGQPIEIYASMSNAKSRSFVMNGLFYLFDGTNFLQYDGTTVTSVVPYIPVTRTGAAPDGTNGFANEQHNLLGAGFENWFTGNATSTVYKLTQTNLDATAVVASIDFGVTYNQVETTHFTVNRTTGEVTWNAAPPTTTDANNVRIRAFKTIASHANKIKQSKGVFLFGGANDTRVFVWNGHTLYRSATYKPNYFPENQFQQIGTEDEPIMGMCLQYDSAIISKTYSKWLLSVDDSDLLNIKYPIRPLNNAVGCQASESIQLINNNVFALTDTGFWELVGSNVRDERNVSHQSRRVDAWLLNETDFANAISVDFDNKYFLTFPATGNTYIWDYAQPQQDPNQKGEWYFWDNIKASCFYWLENTLYFGSSTDGLIYRFTNPSETNSYSDDGVAINAIWDSALIDFGAPENLKTVKKLHFTMKPYNRTSVDAYYFSEENVPQLLGTSNMSLFSYEGFSYDNFSYLLSTNPQVSMFKVKAKKVTHFQLRFSNNRIYERFGLLSIVLTYAMKRLVK